MGVFPQYLVRDEFAGNLLRWVWMVDYWYEREAAFLEGRSELLRKSGQEDINAHAISDNDDSVLSNALRPHVGSKRYHVRRTG